MKVRQKISLLGALVFDSIPKSETLGTFMAHFYVRVLKTRFRVTFGYFGSF